MKSNSDGTTYEKLLRELSAYCIVVLFIYFFNYIQQIASFILTYKFKWHLIS